MAYSLTFLRVSFDYVLVLKVLEAITRFFIRNIYIRTLGSNQAKIKKQLRNTGRLSFKSKIEKSIFARKFLIELETK